MFLILIWLNIVYNLLQEVVLHASDCVVDPQQAAPPLDGGGFEQLLCLILMPDPHVTLHGPYLLQLDHPPFTTETRIFRYIMLST